MQHGKCDTSKFSPKSRAGFIEWPHNPEETQGYVMAGARENNTEFHLHPDPHVDVYKLPKRIRNLEPLVVVATFHSHPVGCDATKCYYQPPSLKDLKSMRKLSTGPLNIAAHIVVTEGRLFFVHTEPGSSDARFRTMMADFKSLQDRHLDPASHEPLWLELAAQYPDIMQVSVLGF